MIPKQTIEEIKGRTRIEDLIGSVPEPREQNLLRYKYLQGMSWAMIARKMVISEPYAYQIHSRALQSAGKYHSKS